MMTRSMGIFFTRMFSVYMIILSIKQLPVAFSVYFPQVLQDAEIDKPLLLLVAYGPVLACLIFGLIIWIFSGKIARLLGDFDSKNQNTKDFNLKNFELFILSSVGIIIIVNAIPGLYITVANIIYSHKNEVIVKDSGSLYLIKYILEILLGIGLILGRENIIKMINK